VKRERGAMRISAATDWNRKRGKSPVAGRGFIRGRVTAGAQGFPLGFSLK
jgi:hypothetical protein